MLNCGGCHNLLLLAPRNVSPPVQRGILVDTNICRTLYIPEQIRGPPLRAVPTRSIIHVYPSGLDNCMDDLHLEGKIQKRVIDTGGLANRKGVQLGLYGRLLSYHVEVHVCASEMRLPSKSCMRSVYTPSRVLRGRPAQISQVND